MNMYYVFFYSIIDKVAIKTFEGGLMEVRKMFK